MATNTSGLLVIERILRDRQGIWRQIVEERGLNRLTLDMLASSAAALAIYGIVLGSFHGPLMALTSAIKLPLLFGVTLAICLPTLYLFNLVFGARLSVRQAVALVMTAITVTALLALAFAPISLFFRITAPDYGFFKLLNVAILALSAFVGLRFLTSGMKVLNEHGLLSPESARPAVTDTPPAPMGTDGTATTGGAPANGAAVDTGGDGELEPVPVGAVSTSDGRAVTAAVPAPAAPRVAYAMGTPTWVGGQPHYGPARPVTQPRPKSMTLLYIWILLFGFVGTQLAWTLRPFFGNPGEPFALFREIEGNFYAEILRTIAGL